MFKKFSLGKFKQQEDLTERVTKALGTWGNEFDIPEIVQDLLRTNSSGTIDEWQLWTVIHKYDMLPEDRAI